MASEDDDFDLFGIEASDLASLLCRFEEATCSTSDLFTYQPEASETLMNVKTSGNTLDSLCSTLLPSDRSNGLNKMEVEESPLSCLLTNNEALDFSFDDLHQYLTEPLSLEMFTAQSPSHADHLTTMVEDFKMYVSSKLPENIFEVSENTAELVSQIPDSDTNVKEFSLKHDDFQWNASDELDLQKYMPSTTLASSVDNSYVVSEPCQMHIENSEISANAFEENHTTDSNSTTLESLEFSLFHKTEMAPAPLNETEQIIHSLSCVEDGEYVESSSQFSPQHFIDFTSGNYCSSSDHNYCCNRQSLSEMSRHENGETLNSSYVTQSKVTIIDNPAPSQCSSGFSDGPSAYTLESHHDFIVEGKEVVLDSDGNDLYSNNTNKSSDIKCDLSLINNENVKRNIWNERRQRLKRWFLHTGINVDIGSEKSDVLFDKIPSYYTALSIPSKPVTTTVFASATKAIGCTDHLDLLDSKVEVDDSQYDKVPAHRRCFTNTAKEVDIKLNNTCTKNITNADLPEQTSFETFLPDENHSISLDENHPVADVNQTSGPHLHYSKVQKRRSRSVTRRSCSASRFSRRSASSTSNCSTCSSCSNNSYCSTCSYMSRSPSSSGSERGSSVVSNYSRTRSRSPGSNRDSRNPSKKSRCSFTPLKYRRSRSRTVSPFDQSSHRSRQYSHRSKHSRSMERTSERRKMKEKEQLKAMEERRVVYVGKIPDGYTKKQLYQRFQCFGEIREVKVNFREHGDNYGFVTFTFACDAIAAKERGNSIPGEVKFDLCFGGRRHFCPDQYADLDGNREIEEEYAPVSENFTGEMDYAALLKLHSTHQKRK